MSEQLDNELRNRINEVFDNYEDTAPAEEGWLLLRQKFPVNKKRPALAIWWSAAAVLLLLSILGTWVYTQQSKNNIVAVKPVNKPLNPVSKTDQSHQDSALKPKKGTDHITSPIPRTEEYAILTPKNLVPPNVITVVGSKVISTPYPKATTQHPDIRIADNGTFLYPLVKNTAPIADSSKQNINPNQTQPLILAQQTNKAQTKATTASTTDSSKADGESKMSIYLANEQKKEAAKKSKTDTKLATDKKVLYSVYAATYFNYAEGSKSQINTGAGFSTDIKLAGNFKLSAGIAIGKNTLNYNSQPTQSGLVMDAMRAASNSGVANDAVQNSASASFGFSSLRVLASPVVSAYNISLTGLDLPINIKYEFNPKKSDSYISAGLSSGTFISETYNYSYDNSLNALGASPSIPDASVSRSFTRFDFARTLNVSLGMGYQLTKSNRLIIEPFLKYPLSGMGSQDIRFGSGGINLRLKFQGSSKKK